MEYGEVVVGMVGDCGGDEGRVGDQDGEVVGGVGDQAGVVVGDAWSQRGWKAKGNEVDVMIGGVEE